MKPGDKVYVSKYALTNGVRILKVFNSYALAVPQFVDGLRLGREVHTTWTEALAAAEQMRTKKIASLRKQIAKLEKLEFKEPKQ